MLSQAEADALIAMKKRFVTSTAAVGVAPGEDATHELVGDVDDERFLLDLARGRRRVAKLKFQTRAHKVVVLLRLDLNGSPHTNPDGHRLEGTHLHVYREGFDDKWAYPLDSDEFADPASGAQTFADFCALCHLAPTPTLQEALS